jgi:hypothetical protein
MAEEKAVVSAAQTATESKVEKIREILLGAQRQEFETRLDQMEHRLSRKIADVRKDNEVQLARVEAFARGELKALAGRYQRIVEGLEGGLQAIDELKGSAAPDLTERLESLDRRLSELAREVRGRFDQQAVDLLSKLSGVRDELTDLMVHEGYKYFETMRSVRDDLSGLVVRETDKFLQNNTFRDALVAMLTGVFPEGKIEAKQPTRVSKSLREFSSEERERMITEVAYRRAKRRGFTGGSSEQDWREAEAEVDRALEMAARLAEGESRELEAESDRQTDTREDP